MEFDNDTPVSDNQRHLAESKKLTLQPVHADVQPEDISASEVVARHLNAPAIANIEDDTEQNKAAIQPSASLLSRPEATSKRSNGFIPVIVTAAAASALLIGTILFFK